VSVELVGEVGCYSLLVRAVRMFRETADDTGDPLWSYIAQELCHVDSIDGTLMQMMLTHRLPEAGACRSAAESRAGDASISVKTLLQLFPTVLPASLSQLIANPSALLGMHGECVSVVSTNVLQITCTTCSGALL